MASASEPFCIRSLHSPADYLFGPVLSLYRASMPKPLREPDEVLTWRLENPDARNPFHLIAAVGSDGQVLGYAMGHYFSAENLGFLAYIAADPAARGKGLGSALYLAFMERCVADAQRLRNCLPAGICLEAETPPVWHDPDLERECRRRLEFYRRLGAEPVPGVDYRLPVPGCGWRRFYLLYHPIARRLGHPRQARQLARSLLRREYGVRRPEAWVS